MVKPVLLAVHDEPGDLRLIQQELTDRYARDYEIICTDSPASALHRLAALRADAAAAVLVLFAAVRLGGARKRDRRHRRVRRDGASGLGGRRHRVGGSFRDEHVPAG